MPNFSYVRIYADDRGESNFEDVIGEMSSTDFAPPAPPTFIGGSWSVSTSLFFSAPENWDGDWHPVPARQFMAILKGQFEITVSDGESRLINPGDLLLVEDLTGKGHYTRNVTDGAENLVFVTRLSDE